MCGFDRRTSVVAALAQLEARVVALGGESISVTAACQRVLCRDVVAGCAVPHFRRAMMDGYAVIAESTFGATESAPIALRVIGEVRAG